MSACRSERGPVRKTLRAIEPLPDQMLAVNTNGGGSGRKTRGGAGELSLAFTQAGEGQQLAGRSTGGERQSRDVADRPGEADDGRSRVGHKHGDGSGGVGRRGNGDADLAGLAEANDRVIGIRHDGSRVPGEETLPKVR